MPVAGSTTTPERVPHLAIITTCAIGGTLLQSLDQTIANVALPYMQGSFASSYDEITWVVTSYIAAAAIMTAPVGWLAARFGRKWLYVVSIVGFTLTSMLCVAQSLWQIVLFRLLQGMFSASLVPLAQTTLFDLYPHERHGFAMAIWGVGVMIGPIVIEYADMAAYGSRTAFENANPDWKRLFASQPDSPETLLSVELLTSFEPTQSLWEGIHPHRRL
jgi:MFS family permease